MCALDMSRVLSGKDTRTTLRVANVPNKFTQQKLLSLLEESHTGTFDFFYLPFDFNNEGNLGYFFVNMTSPAHIPSFHAAFNGCRWPGVNSEKICEVRPIGSPHP